MYGGSLTETMFEEYSSTASNRTRRRIICDDGSATGCGSDDFSKGESRAEPMSLRLNLKTPRKFCNNVNAIGNVPTTYSSSDGTEIPEPMRNPQLLSAIKRRHIPKQDGDTSGHGQQVTSVSATDQTFNPCYYVCSSRRGSHSTQPVRTLKRSYSYPLDRTRESESFHIKPGHSYGQLLVKTSYIHPELLSHSGSPLAHNKSDSTKPDQTTGFIISNKFHTMRDRYITLSVRILSLFTLGVVFGVLLNFLQKQRKVTIFSPGLFGDILNCEWWMPPAFGFGSTVVGLLYPFLDRLVGTRKSFTLEWSNVMRCIAVFVGINHATAKINFESNIHLAMTLAALSLGLWYFFDQSLLGLSLGIISTGVATVITQLLVAADVFGYSNPDFLYMRSWVPCLYFSGGITIGVVGRALAKLDTDSSYAPKEHVD